MLRGQIEGRRDRGKQRKTYLIRLNKCMAEMALEIMKKQNFYLKLKGRGNCGEL